MQNQISRKAKTTIVFLYSAFVAFSCINDFFFFDFSHTERTSYYVASGNPYAVPFYLLIKAVFCILVFFSFRYIERIRNKKADKGKALFILATLIGYILVFLHISPGIWWCNGADEFTTLSFAKHLTIQYHQGVMASVAYILALMCWPSPEMIVLFQMLIGAVILGSIAYDLYKEKPQSEFAFIALIFSPAALYFSGYPMRAYLFSVFFLAFIHYFLKLDSESATWSEVCKTTLLLCIVINYRIEVVPLLVIYPFLLSLKKCKLNWIIKAISLLLSSLILISTVNKLGYQANSKAHNTIMVIGPLSEFLSDETRSKEQYEEDILDIDKVLDVNFLKENHSYTLAQGERPDSEYTDEEYGDYLKAVINILTRNPDIYIKCKVKGAMDSLGLSSYSWLGFAFPENVMPTEVADNFDNIDIENHNIFTRILSGQYKVGAIKMYYIWYSFWIPCLLMLCIVIWGGKRKNSLRIASGIMLVHLVLTIFFAPSRYQMYYFAEYFVGWYLVIRVLDINAVGAAKNLYLRGKHFLRKYKALGTSD